MQAIVPTGVIDVAIGSSFMACSTNIRHAITTRKQGLLSLIVGELIHLNSLLLYMNQDEFKYSNNIII